MAAVHPSDLQLASQKPFRTNLAHKVQTLLAHLMEIGRPTPLAKLVARCNGVEMSPEIVKFLCSLPGSPVRLTEDRLVTYRFGFAGGIRFRFGSILRGLESEGVRGKDGVLNWRFEFDFVKRKRRWSDLTNSEFMPAKRRARLVYCNDDENESEVLGLNSKSRSSIKEVTPLPAVYRRRSPRNHRRGSVGLFSHASSRKLIANSETLLVGSDVGVSGHVTNIMSCFKDSKTTACSDILHCAVLESNKVETSDLQPLPFTDDKMTGYEACTTITRGAISLSSLPATGETGFNDKHLGIQDISYSDMISPQKVCEVSPPPSRNQLVLIEQDFKIDTDQILQQDKKTAAKESSQICSMVRRGSKIDNSPCSHMEGKRDLKRETKDIVPAADNLGFRRTEKVVCGKAINSQKSKFPIEEKNLLMNSMKKLSNIENINKKATTKDISAAMTHDHFEENKHADALLDQSKKNADPKTRSEQKIFPSFEAFIVEEEEGSGGYGTVFKARRKSDNEIFAIKCPHPNAPRNHVYNELSMLHRFGGKNFIIRLEDSFKYENSRCFVLEHVVHDRPEVLKREIDVSQLRWYAYCMFEALANLHKHGIIHRDIKPGNFLFSREVNIGYLIDFNLAMDLHQKNRPLKRPKLDSDSTAAQTQVSSIAHNQNKTRKSVSAKNKAADVRAVERASNVDSKISKLADSRTKNSALFKGKQNVNKNHAALDDSGVTSIKDMTSSKTRPVDQMRQPMPYNGRKEILKLAKEAMQATKHKALHVPVLKSKRILATPEKEERKQAHFSPMPLQLSGAAVVNTGLLGHKGDDKKLKEGPCAGTKGFRAPEVLFRSAHQGPKIDVWSAGVTLLYLMIGKTPFYGDVNENIKGIAKLRGSEDLWEVAKLHNQETAFPEELLDVKFLPSIELREWCQLNSKRPSFMNEVPDVLYDFLDKCLTVNPRRRMSAEEALRHEFLAPCRDMLVQQLLPSSPIL